MEGAPGTQVGYGIEAHGARARRRGLCRSRMNCWVAALEREIGGAKPFGPAFLALRAGPLRIDVGPIRSFDEIEPAQFAVLSWSCP